MLNEPITIERKKAKEFPPLPKDVYQVELLNISAEDRATFDTRNKPEAEKIFEKVFNFQFVVLDHKELRGRNLWGNFIPTYLYWSKKGPNKLVQIITAFLGHDITPEEESKLNNDYLNSLIGKQIRVLVDVKEKDEKKFNNITSYLTASDNLLALTAEEKEQAIVKNKEKTDARRMLEPGDPGYTNPDDIPF